MNFLNKNQIFINKNDMKLIISENQLKLIANHINENVILVKENVKDTTLALLTLAGVKLSGQNKFIADNALKDVDSLDEISKIMNSVDTLEAFTSEVDKLVPKASEKIKNNITKIVDNLSKIRNN